MFSDVGLGLSLRNNNGYGGKSITSDPTITGINPFDNHTDFINQGTGSAVTDSVIKYDQSASVRMDMTAGQNVNLKYDLPATIDFTKTSITLAMRTSDRAGHLASTVTLWEGANTSVIEGLTGQYMRHDDEWTVMALNIGDLSAGGGAADLTKIDRINVRYASSTNASVWVNSLGYMANAFPLQIFLTFDDSNESDLTVAKPILDADNMIATSFIRTDVIGTAGKLTAANIQSLSAAGSGIGSHSAAHINYATSSEAQIIADLALSKSDLLAIGIDTLTFAYPFGSWDELSESLVPDYFRLRADTTPKGMAPSRDWVGRIYRKDGEVAVVADLTNYIDELVVHGGSLGLLWHEIGGTGYDSVKFQSIITHIAGLVTGGNAVITTLEDYYT